MKSIKKVSLLTALMLSTASLANAEEVTLRSPDGQLDLTGEFVSFVDGVYTVRTNIGTLKLGADRVECFGDACPSGETAAATDNQITLKSSDGSIELSGELLRFEQGTYFIKTAFGVLDVSANGISCVGGACPNTAELAGEFAVTGSSELTRTLLPALIDGFTADLGAQATRSVNDQGAQEIALSDSAGNAVVSITLASGDSSDALNGLLQGGSDLAVTTRAVREEELERFLTSAAGDVSRPGQENVLALDGLSIVVSPSNPVRTIGEEEIAGIFAGTITNWDQIGGTSGPINLYVRSEDSGTGSVFNNLLMDPADSVVSENAQVVSSDVEVALSVVDDPQGIGFTSFSAQQNARSLAIRGVCGIQTPANAFTIKTEEYPLTRRLYMYQSENSTPRVAREFVEFVESDAAQEIVSSKGYVDQSVSAVSVNEQGLRFVASVLPSDADVTFPQVQEMMQELVAADRLSLTFRFEQGSSRLDSRAEGDVLRLVEMINRGDFKNKELLAIGFTDSIGLGFLNEELSRDRAEQVRRSIVAAADPAALQDIELKSVGYGEMSPLGCNQTFNGRRINRRVEIWAKDIVRSRF